MIVTGCGTAGNAALAGTYLFEEICGRAVTMIPASEFRYRSRTLDAQIAGHRAVAERRDRRRARRDDRGAAARGQTGGDRQCADVDARPNGGDARASARRRPSSAVLATKSYTTMLATLLLTAHAVDRRWSTGAESGAAVPPTPSNRF